MNSSAFFPTPERVQSLMTEHNLLSGAEREWIRVLPVSWDRRASISRRHYQVWAGDSCRTHVYVGRGIAPYYKRAVEFHEACGKLTPRPEFLFQSDGFEFYGREFVTGTTLQEACESGAVSAIEVENVLCGIQEQLAGTERPSTLPRMYRELDELAARLDRVELFTPLDRELLRLCVWPELKARLSERKARTRWSNGDFIARNIVLDSRGGARLIDDEFAARTHFFEEDWIRVGRYSQLPVGVQDLPKQLLGADYDTINLYSLLRQIALEAEVKPQGELRTALHWAVEQMLPLVDRDGALFRRSVFLSRAAGQHHESGPVRTPVAKLFYAAGEGFDEEHSVSQNLIENEWQQVQISLPLPIGAWHLRLDPTDCPGLLELHSLEVKSLASGRTLFSSDDEADLSRMRVDGTATRLPGKELLRLFSHGGDPQLVLPQVSLPDGGPILVEFWLHAQPLLPALRRTLPGLLRKMAGAPDADAAARLAELQQQGAWAALRAQLAEMKSERDALAAEVAAAKETADTDRAAFEAELSARNLAMDAKIGECEAEGAAEVLLLQAQLEACESEARDQQETLDALTVHAAVQTSQLAAWREMERQQAELCARAADERVSRYAAQCLDAEHRAEGMRIELQAAFELMDEQMSVARSLDGELAEARGKLLAREQELARSRSLSLARETAESVASLREIQWSEQMRWLANRMKRMQDQAVADKQARAAVTATLAERTKELAAAGAELADAAGRVHLLTEEYATASHDGADREAALRFDQQLCSEKIEFLRHRTREVEEQLRDVYRSFSWRAMAPVRKIAETVLTLAPARAAHVR